jgi:peptidyl-prolyl cis-trans isomerase SurA
MPNRFSRPWTVRARAVAMAAVVALLMIVSAAAPAQQEFGIAAVVGEKSITIMDLLNRTRLVMFAGGLTPTEENMKRLMPQILNTLIDEALQMQEAKVQNVTVRDTEVENALADMEQRNNLPPGGLDGFLESRGLEKNSLVTQVHASIAWAKLVDRRLRPQVEIGDAEVDAALGLIEENRGKPQFLASEIFLSVDDSAAEAPVRDSAIRIAQQIREGATFESLARAFSQNATAASGGDLGWLTAEQFDEEVGRVLATMQPGQIAGPIRAQDGYHIIVLRDHRLPGGATADKVTVDLRQIGLPLAPTATEEEVRAALTAADAIRVRAADCAALEDASLEGDATVTRIGRIRVADLAAPLQATVMRLDTNQISAPLRTEQGIVLFMVCERDAGVAQLPPREQVQQRLELEKLDLLARRYLRDLRRAAIVDVRI